MSIFKYFLDILFQKKCFSCGEIGDYLCSNCLKNKTLKFSNCFLCIDKNNGSTSKNCRKCRENVVIDGIISLFNYHDDAIKKLIYNFKYKLAYDIGYFLAREMAKVVNNNCKIDDNFIIIPVPVSRKRFNQRGFNQSYVLAREMSKILNIEFYGNVLCRVNETEKQFKLSETERRDNLKKAFFVDKYSVMCNNLFNKYVLLVDDIITTGSTVSCCTKVLKMAGFGKVFVVTVART